MIPLILYFVLAELVACVLYLREVIHELKLHRELNWGRPMGGKEVE